MTDRADRRRAGKRPLVIGIGNPGRGDDGIGPHVVDRVRAAEGDAIETLAVEGDLADLSLRWDRDQVVVIVDAMASGCPPGTVMVVDGLADDLATDRVVSSHGVGLAEALGLGRALGRLPCALTIVAIEASSFVRFEPLSDAVRAAGAEVASRIWQIVQAADTA